jgi:hypothetical protein
MRFALVLCCSVALLGSVGTVSAQDWTKSKWGPNDEIGAANYMTPELVLKAAQLIKTGKTYALGIPVSSTTPAYPPRGFKITIVQPGQAGSPGLGPTKTTYNDDIIEGWVTTKMLSHHLLQLRDLRVQRRDDADLTPTSTLTRHDFHGDWNYSLTPPDTP